MLLGVAVGWMRPQSADALKLLGIAGGAIVMLATTLDAPNYIPIAAIGIILGVHRLLSSVFVPVNVLGNALATIAIAHGRRGRL
jgi:Na+/H+-dicarboxylate symporter